MEPGQHKAHEMATKQRDIGVAEFFARNRHLLGFDNKRKALLTTIKEAVDNSLDACEEAGILPEINVEIIDMQNDRFRVIIEDNGPGIVKEQIPSIFAKLLYGSKFHSLKQSRGQQGIGISASVMYGQLTTGRASKVMSKIGEGEPAHVYELKIDTKTNKPEIISDATKEWSKPHGTKIQIDLEGLYQKGGQSVDEYLKETAVVNPHVTIIYTNPKAEQLIFPRATDVMPVKSEEIKPHPYGVELGVFMKMLEVTPSKTFQQFMTTEFSKVSPKVVKEICEIARILPNVKPKKISHEEVEKIVKAIPEVKIHAPSTDCISPITAELLEKGIKKEINAEFYASVSRSPAVYRGNPFQIEVALAYGGDQPKDKQARVMRFANRVPLLFQQGACGVTKAIQSINWKPYGLNQSSGSLPVGPLTILVHISSVWVPFTSESKEAIAHYPEILAEIKLALQEAGRSLAKYTAKKAKVKGELKKRSFIQKYMPHVATGLQEILGLDKADEEEILRNLDIILEAKRGKLDNMEFDPTKNEEYDEEWAKIGKEESSDEEYGEEREDDEE
ncbi:MAG: DNA topoisomerase VI subunit B [Nanoarchaeota archaeon]|nr:DNA topoisomerase VI subunit B [Nanoarchaeota archaeon]